MQKQRAFAPIPGVPWAPRTLGVSQPLQQAAWRSDSVALWLAAVLGVVGVVLVGAGAWAGNGALDWVGVVAGLVALMLVPAMCTSAL